MNSAEPSREELFIRAFETPEAVARYAEGPRRFIPGLEALHRMTGLLLAERAQPEAKILVLGAGGGSEIAAMAAAHPGWRFVGVDPAGEMLKLAEQVCAPFKDRVSFVQGYIEDAPEGPFDSATCLLTLHFLNAKERTGTLRELHRRLRPAAPFVAAHMSFPQAAGEREQWLDRYASYPVAMGADPGEVGKARAMVAANLDALSPEEDEAIMQASGFSGITLFYAAFTWRGWVAYA